MMGEMMEDLEEGYEWSSSGDSSSSGSSSSESSSTEEAEEGVAAPSPRPRTPGYGCSPSPRQTSHPSPAVLAWASKVVAEGGAPAGEEEADAAPRRGGLASLLAPTALPAEDEPAAPTPGVTAGDDAVIEMAAGTPEGAACPPPPADGRRGVPPSPPPRRTTSEGEVTVDPGARTAASSEGEETEGRQRRRRRECRQGRSAGEAAAASAAEEARLTEGKRRKALKARYRRERVRARAMTTAAAAVAPPSSTPPARSSAPALPAAARAPPARSSAPALPAAVRAPPAEHADTAAARWGPGGRPERRLFGGAPLQAGAVGSGRWAWCVACDRPTLHARAHDAELHTRRGPVVRCPVGGCKFSCPAIVEHRLARHLRDRPHKLRGDYRRDRWERTSGGENPSFRALSVGYLRGPADAPASTRTPTTTPATAAHRPASERPAVRPCSVVVERAPPSRRPAQRPSGSERGGDQPVVAIHHPADHPAAPATTPAAPATTPAARTATPAAPATTPAARTGVRRRRDSVPGGVRG
ncbi:PREDICTED: skin secretory protein xP2-like [Priapulus caudatus]|uniref:Skin secretory protein xP2-like n=1 Tax=Priapulus caudatus TaxID=37621 RepID=A0ABM1F3S8_PRICU|nr:PREDICTED: skin secretory protein xP2-like [Priapulus caudatus]